MGLGEFLKSPQSCANPEVIDARFHEDFIYPRETEMLTRDEFIQHLETDFVNGPHVSKQGKIFYEDEKIGAFEHAVLRPVSKRKVTIVCLKKDGEIWRQMMTYEEINDLYCPYEASCFVMS